MRESGKDVGTVLPSPRGEYIGFLDSDDYVVPTFAEALYTAAKSNDADIAVCGFDRIDLKNRKAALQRNGAREGTLYD